MGSDLVKQGEIKPCPARAGEDNPHPDLSKLVRENETS
jgi:hypothetical protein